MFRRFVSFVLPTIALGLTGCGVDATEAELAQGSEQVATTEQALHSFVLNAVNLNFFAPPRTKGDGEFGGNGPRMDVRIELLRLNNNTELWAEMSIIAQERDGNDDGDTRAEGTRRYHIFTAPTWIESVTPVGAMEGFTFTPFTYGFLDTGHGLNAYQFPQLVPASRLVWQLSCVGDTKGDEAGSKTGCEAILHDLAITYY
ncbi:hypothetical protein JQX13_34630 [Archangium violaceum]|uniref:hypothetical protein n=1 Tax=Archangium violaceum TaxID=83451 RepID=UPI00193BE3AE|nr:hypothetical protein [Archangium violaceum]QRK05301.1 hypothetical protein JQX13_34630 [Archangium violaceum]